MIGLSYWESTFRGQRRPAALRLRATSVGRTLAPALLLLFAGIELSVLVRYLPDTLDHWRHADRVGDWPVFYNAAANLTSNGLYNPGLALIQHPLTYFSIAMSYRIWVAGAAAAVLAAAFVAQRAVQSPEAKLAVVLGILSLPELHWALRGAVLAPYMALAAIAGLLLLERHPRIAGICLAVLTLKPQFAVVPLLYLLFRRNRPATVAFLGATLVSVLAGMAVIGFDYTGQYIRYLVDWGSDQRDNLAPAAQTWQHAWPGFLISVGIEPAPPVWMDLLALSLAAIVIVWWRSSKAAQLTATALGILLVTPYAMFYDWALLVVGGTLLLRTRPRIGALVPLLLIGGYAAAIATQAATPVPLPQQFLDNPAAMDSTEGIYWTAPFALLAVFALAIFCSPQPAPANAAERESAGELAAPTPGGRAGGVLVANSPGDGRQSGAEQPAPAAPTMSRVPGSRRRRRRTPAAL